MTVGFVSRGSIGELLLGMCLVQWLKWLFQARRDRQIVVTRTPSVPLMGGQAGTGGDDKPGTGPGPLLD
jgi:hypothetical protein